MEAYAVAQASGGIQLPTIMLLERFHLIFVVAWSCNAPHPSNHTFASCTCLRVAVPYAWFAIAQPFTDQLAGVIGRDAPGPREFVTVVQPLRVLVRILVGPQGDAGAAPARGLRNDGSEQQPTNAFAPLVGQHVD